MEKEHQDLLDKLNARRRHAFVLATPVLGCPACSEKRLHTQEEYVWHPLRQHGYTPETGWSHPFLQHLADSPELKEV